MNSNAKEALFNTWYEDALRSYFPGADEAVRRGTGFANPIGQAFHESMGILLDELPAIKDPKSLRAPLDRIVRVLAVQGLPAGACVRFLFLLRNRIEAASDIPAEEKILWGRSLDSLAEMAVEIWTDCRETLFKLRINELRSYIQLLEAGSAPKDRGGIT